MATVNESIVRELAGFSGSDAPVTSLYLDVDGRRYVRPRDLEPHLDALVRQARAKLGSDGFSKSAQQSVERDLSRITDHVRGRMQRSHTRGLALFSCSAHGLWRVVELAVPVRNRVVVNHTPYVRELEAIIARRLHFAVLLADRQQARILLFELGALVDKTELLDRLPRHDDDGGELNRDQVAGMAANAASRHLRRAARATFQVFREQGFDHLVIGAPPDIGHALERELHPYVRERIAARPVIPVHASDDEITHMVQGVEEDLERTRELVLVTRLRNALGTGNAAVAGLEDTLAALVARRVDTLIVSDGYESPGWRCRSCSFVATRGPACPVCDTPMGRVEDVVEEAVEDALTQSCRVAVCTGNADLDVLGRIGALLRY